MSYSSSRLVAAKILSEVLARKTSLKPIQLMPQVQALSPEDVRFVSALCFGTLRFYHRLDKIAQQLLKKPLVGQDQTVYALLLSALYQLDHLDTPPYAVLNETVSAAKQLKQTAWASGLLNGCLRNYLRRKAVIHQALAGDNVAQYAHPHWLIEQFKKAWPDHWITLLENNNQPAPFCLRVDLNKISREAYLEQLLANQQEARLGQWSPSAILLETPCPAKALPPPQNAVYLQDQSTQLAAYLLELKPGQRVLDACAAPGGKALHSLQIEPQLSELVALEVQADRLENLERTLAAYSDRVSIIKGSALEPDTWWDKRLFDRILLDAPCSATGVIRRHPDIKLLREKKDIEKQVEKQWQMLNALWPLLKPDGYLLYSTCSIIPDENAEQVARFIAATRDCEEYPFEVSWGMPCKVGRQILPSSESDGFYYARLRKR